MFELTPPWQDVLDYWFEDGLTQDWPKPAVTRKWFRASAGDDAEIAHRFGAYVEASLQQELVDWERQPQSRLALILLLDQLIPLHLHVLFLLPGLHVHLGLGLGCLLLSRHNSHANGGNSGDSRNSK